MITPGCDETYVIVIPQVQSIVVRDVPAPSQVIIILGTAIDSGGPVIAANPLKIDGGLP